MIKIISIFVSLLLAFASFPFNVSAKMNKCIDVNGDVTYSQTACPNDQKAEKVLGNNKSSKQNMEDCKYAGQFANMVSDQMHSNADVDQTFDRYGGINSISKSTLGVINYVYSFKNTPDVPASRISSLTIARCNARAFGEVKCEDFPGEFQASIHSCDEEQQKIMQQRELMMEQEAPGREIPSDMLERIQSQEQIQEKNLEQKGKQDEKQRIEECKQKYNSKIEKIGARTRQKRSLAERDRLKKQRRELKNKRYSECR